MRSARQDEVMLLAEQRLEIVERLGNWLVVACRKLRRFNEHTVESSLCDENFLWRTLDAEFP